jgi:hypothetical protein
MGTWRCWKERRHYLFLWRETFKWPTEESWDRFAGIQEKVVSFANSHGFNLQPYPLGRHGFSIEAEDWCIAGAYASDEATFSASFEDKILATTFKMLVVY